MSEKDCHERHLKKLGDSSTSSQTLKSFQRTPSKRLLSRTVFYFVRPKFINVGGLTVQDWTQDLPRRQDGTIESIIGNLHLPLSSRYSNIQLGASAADVWQTNFD